MSKNIKISIPKPCHEDRNKMLPTSNGYFCNSCEKEVIDFRNFSDADIQLFFKKMDGNSTCGIFNAPQLVFPDFEAKSYTFNKYFTRFGFGAMAILSSLLSQAQVTKPKKDETFISPKIDKKIAITFPLIITGRVVSNEDDKAMGILKGEPVIGATIIINNSLKGFVVNDIDGNFGIQINENDFINESLIISIQFSGFEKELITINKNNLTNLYFDVKLKLDKSSNKDVVLIGGYSMKKTSLNNSEKQSLNKDLVDSNFYITGKIVYKQDDKGHGTAKGDAVIGAEISIEGTTKSTLTDNLGNFKLKISKNELKNIKIKISFFGTISKVIKAKNMKKITYLEQNEVILGGAEVRFKGLMNYKISQFFKRLFPNSNNSKKVSKSCLPQQK
ncbi:MAG: hypothetical protein EAZ27_05155 [Cytophagales bacterium]|nr:MAG: hypothetical protein EAZ27_05155 [Cytophagales bacterium]